MCGRYYRRSDKQKIAEAFRTGLPTTFEILPSYNVAPQTFQPVVCFNRKTLERELVQMRWGLVPYWAKDIKVGFANINAKAEGIEGKPAFREAFQRRRWHCQINFCRARSAERNTRSRCGNRISPLIRRLGSEDPERRARDEMALKVEGVVNGGMHAKKALGGAS